MIIHTMPQRSEEWFAVKCGKFTGTDFGKLMPTAKQGLNDFNSTQNAIIYRVAAERLTGLKKGQDWGSAPKDFGVDTEDEARVSFILETGLDVQEVGFVELDEYTGCSPDGLICDGEGLEIKCPNSDTHLRYLKSPQDLIDDYQYQCVGGLLCTGRRLWHLYSYDPRFECEDMRSVHVTIDRTEVDRLRARIDAAIAKVKALI
jgi:hypothetical protein